MLPPAGMKQEPIRLCGACYAESPCHKMEWPFKTVRGCVSAVPAKQARHHLCWLLECPNCGARFKVPALSVDSRCQRCLMGFGERANWQKIIV